MNALNRNPCDAEEIARCMNLENRTLSFLPGPTPNTVRSADGKVFTAPKSWVLLPPGDAALTRRIKAAGDCWVVAEKRAEKSFQKVSGHQHARLTGFELNSKLKDPQIAFQKERRLWRNAVTLFKRNTLKTLLERFSNFWPFIRVMPILLGAGSCCG